MLSPVAISKLRGAPCNNRTLRRRYALVLAAIAIPWAIPTTPAEAQLYDPALTNVQATPASIILGQSSTLSWTPREDVSHVYVNGGVLQDERVDVEMGASLVVTPTETGTVTYTLEAEDDEGAPLGEFFATVIVNPTWLYDPALTNVQATPASIILGQSSTLSWTPREDVSHVYVNGGVLQDERVDVEMGASLVVTPTETGTVTYTLEAEDDEGAPLGEFFATVTGRVTTPPPTNQSPVAEDDRGPRVERGGRVTIQAAALLKNDSDPDGDPLAITSVSAAEQGTVLLNGETITFTHDGSSAASEAYSFTYTVSDGNGGTDSATVTGRVTTPPPTNQSPVAEDDRGPRVERGGRVTIQAAALLKNDSDPDGDPLAITSVSAAEQGTVLLNGETITFTHDGSSAASEAYSFTYTVSDGNGGTDSATVTGRVTTPPPTNQSPVAEDDRGPRVERGGRVTIQAAALLKNDSDPDGDPLAITSVSAAEQGTVLLNGETITFTHDGSSAASEAYSFTYTVSDGNGGTDSATVTGRVTTPPPTNQSPVAEDDRGPRVERGGRVTIQAAALLKNDSDPDGDPLAITSVSAAEQGTVLLNGETITFTHDGSAPQPSRPAGFQYTVSDGRGGTDTATVRIVVLSRPEVSQVVVTSDPGADETYGEGDVIEVTATFSEPVTVTGSPQFRLTVGATPRTMSLARASGTEAVFAYTVLWTDRDDDGVSALANALANAGGAIRSQAGVDADLAHDALAAQPGHRVRGFMPPTVDAADAAGLESDGELVFSVTLDQAVTQPVTVQWATAAGTATPGLDYVEASGELILGPGATSASVAVELLDDLLHEGAETIRLELSDPTNGSLERSAATGTIRDDDDPALVEAWLARFARTAAGHALEAVEGRLSGLSGRDSHFTVAGQKLHLSGRKAGPAGGGFRSGAGAGGSSGYLGMSAPAGGFGPTQEGYGLSHGVVLQQRPGGPGALQPRRGGPFGSFGPSSDKLGGVLGRSSFQFSGSGGGTTASGRTDRFALNHLGPVQTAEDEAVPSGSAEAGAGWTIWGSGATTRFGGGEADLSLDGDVATGTVGVDFQRGRVTFGVAASHSFGEGDFRERGAAGSGREGDLESSVTIGLPYLRVALSDRSSIWGVLGSGRGSLKLSQGGLGSIETDIAMDMGAFGFRHDLKESASDCGCLDLALKSDVLVVNATSDESAALPSLNTDVNRARLMVEMTRARKLNSGAVLAPTAELGVRYDDGDAETGSGMEVGAGLRYANALRGVLIELKGRSLLTHQSGELTEWGLSGALRVDPGPADRGLAFGLRSSYGQTSSGLSRLWERQEAMTLGYGPTADMQTAVEADLGYGLRLHAAGGVMPYIGVALSQGSGQAYRLGGRLKIGESLRLDLEGARRDGGGRLPSDFAVRVLGNLRW